MVSLPESNGRVLAQRLIAHEQTVEGGSSDAIAVVCHKLFLEVGQFIGPEGFRVLLARALHVARPEFTVLADVRVGNPEGGDCLPGLADSGVDGEVVQAAAAAVLGGFIDLLSTFIGNDLALRMIHRRWPDVQLSGPRSVDKGKHNG